MKNKSQKITTIIIIMLLSSLVISISTVSSIEENDQSYDCSMWSTDSTVVDLGTTSWPLLDGQAEVSGFKIINLDNCICADCIDLSNPEYNCAYECYDIIPFGLTHRGDIGLGVAGQINDQVDNMRDFEFIEISFINAQIFHSFEIRSIFITTDSATEQGAAMLFLGQDLVAEFNFMAVDESGVFTFPLGSAFNNFVYFDRIIFLVHPKLESKEYSGFSVAKLETSDNSISFVDPIEGVDCDPLNEPPVADAGGPYSGFEDENITFDGSGSYDPDGSITELTWSNTIGSSLPSHMGTGEVISYAFDAPGIYNVSLRVTAVSYTHLRAHET